MSVGSRILIAVHGYPPAQTGGAERRAARTARGLASRGHAVMVLTIGSLTNQAGELSWDDANEDGVLVRRLSLGTAAGLEPFVAGYDNPLTARAVVEACEEFRPDVFHLFSGYLMTASAVRAAAACGAHIVLSLTDYWWLCHRITLIRTNGRRCDGPTPVECARCQAETRRRFSLPGRTWPSGADRLWDLAAHSDRIGRLLGSQAQIDRSEYLIPTLGLADALISPSQYLAGVYERYGVDREKIRVWRQGVDLDQCPLGIPSTTLRVGYLGQIKPHKGVDLLISAWKRLDGNRPRQLVLYGAATGEPAYESEIRTAVSQRDDMSWPGEFRGEAVWEILANLDLVVVPSRWVENSPNTILEAQAVGVPVVGTDLGGVAELIHHDVNGLLFACDYVEDLARQLQRILDEPDLLPRLRSAPLSFKSVDDEIEEIAALYRRILTGRIA